WCLLCCSLILGGTGQCFSAEVVAGEAASQQSADPISQFFESGAIPELRFQVTPETEERLRKEPRKYVSVGLTEDGKTKYEGVQIKLKGGAGSYKPYDSRPSLTVRIKSKGSGFHGLKKFYLNNSSQDP